MKKLAVLFILISFLFTHPPLFAQESSPSAGETIRNAVKEKVMEKIQNIVSRKVGLVGTITSLTENTLTSKSNSQDFTITTTADTQYQRSPGKRAIKREELELNQPVIILGHQQLDSSTIAAGLIQLIPAPTVPKRQTLTAVIDNINKNNLTIITSDNQTWTIKTNKLTQYAERNDDEITTIKSTALKSQDKIIVGGNPNEQEPLTLQAAFILRQPSP